VLQELLEMPLSPLFKKKRFRETFPWWKWFDERASIINLVFIWNVLDCKKIYFLWKLKTFWSFYVISKVKWMSQVKDNSLKLNPFWLKLFSEVRFHLCFMTEKRLRSCIVVSPFLYILNW
jgi:hypothetical protein